MATADNNEDVEDVEERNHWRDVMRTLLMYSDFVAHDLQNRQEHLNRVKQSWANRLPDVTFTKLEGIEHAAQANQQIFDEIVDFQSDGNSPHPDDGPRIGYSQQHRNQAILHSFYREWSEEGASERAQSFGPLIEELQRLLPVSESNAYQQRVLVPGSGLGRLPLEIASKGYQCQGNEFSAFMAMASNFVLNAISEEKMYTIYPWLEIKSNIVKVSDIMTPIQIPDIAAGRLLESCPYCTTTNDAIDDDNEGGNGAGETSTKKRKVFFPRFSMCAGDFVELYKRKSGSSAGDQAAAGKAAEGAGTAAGAAAEGAEGAGPGMVEEDEELWDAVVTCFFVDTAPVVVEYVETIYGMLKPGGVWVNLGPLLYHWTTDVENNEDPRYQQSVELSWEELRHVIGTFGFEFQKEEFRECQYTNNKQSIMWTTYNAILFSVIKPLSS